MSAIYGQSHAGMRHGIAQVRHIPRKPCIYSRTAPNLLNPTDLAVGLSINIRHIPSFKTTDYLRSPYMHQCRRQCRHGRRKPHFFIAGEAGLRLRFLEDKKNPLDLERIFCFYILISLYR